MSIPPTRVWQHVVHIKVVAKGMRGLSEKISSMVVLGSTSGTSTCTEVTGAS